MKKQDFMVSLEKQMFPVFEKIGKPKVDGDIEEGFFEVIFKTAKATIILCVEEREQAIDVKVFFESLGKRKSLVRFLIENGVREFPKRDPELPWPDDELAWIAKLIIQNFHWLA